MAGGLHKSCEEFWDLSSENYKGWNITLQFRESGIRVQNTKEPESYTAVQKSLGSEFRILKRIESYTAVQKVLRSEFRILKRLKIYSAV